ncbi:hypothetical protein KI387_005377, partial [Taxus chinensis]
MSKKWMSICLTALSALAMHFTFAAIAHLWISNSIFPALLEIVGGFFVWLIQGQWCKRRTGISTSAPTFVFVSIWILWALYILLLRRDVCPTMDVAFNTQCFVLSIGLWRMLWSDPGYVRNENISSESTGQTILRVTGSDKSKFEGHFIGTGTNIQPIDGQQNHCLFILLLVAFVSAEMCYFLCVISWISSIKNFWERQSQVSHLVAWIVSSSLFAIIQVFWQVPFLFWHLYCISLNITTDEWVNWEKYPEFQVERSLEP